MILIVGAMNSELSHLIDSLGNYAKINDNPRHYLGKINKKKVIVAESGIGKVQSAYSLTRILLNYKIDLIINIGLAGATNSFKIGEVVKIRNAYYHDFDLTAFGYQFGQVPGQPAFYSSDTKMLSSFKILKDLREADLYTQDSFLKEAILNKNEYCVDMEGAALFHVANNFNIPMISLKIVSDILGKTEFEEFKSFEMDSGGIIISEIIRRIMED